MKKYGLIFCLCLLSATTVKTEFQPCYAPGLGGSATYWNTVDNACNGCGEGCSSCVEELTPIQARRRLSAWPFALPVTTDMS